MKALVWKELRENILWALLAMLALGAAELYGLHHSEYPQQFDINFNDGMTLCRKLFLTVTLFGCPIVGLALGLLQVLPELKQDRWAALLHRPVARGRFFWGKALAGVLLYAVAAGVPFLYMIWHVARPGNFPVPFVPEMICPSLADLATGLGYYFAGLLAALQMGPLVLRALPLFAALHVSFFALNENLFRVVVEAAGAMSLLLCLAGWGAMHARESLGGRPWLGRIAFLAVAFYGACGVGDLTKTLGGMAGRMGDEKYSVWEVLDNGSPVREDYANDVLIATTDVHGQPFTDPKYRPDMVRSHTLGLNVATSYVGDSHGWHRSPYTRSYRETWTYLYNLQGYGRPHFELWFHIASRQCFVGMLPLEKKTFALLGADGFAPVGAPVRGFPENVSHQQIGADRLVINDPDSLRIAYLAKRQIVPVALPAPGPIYGICHAWARIGNGSIDFKGVALRNSMVVFDAGSRVVATLPYHYDVDRWGSLSMGVLESQDRFVLLYEPSDWIERSARKAMPGYLDLTDTQGRVLASSTLPRLPPNVSPAYWKNFVAERLQSPAFFFGEMLYRRIGAAFGSQRLREALGKQLGSGFQATREVGRILVLIGLVLAGMTFAWARRGQLPARQVWAWTGGVLVLGLPGFVMFWLAAERPRTVPCPACRRPRRIAEENCAHCGAAWPPSPIDETGIFDRTPGPSLTASV